MMMGTDFKFSLCISIVFATTLTTLTSHAANISIPPCPKDTTRIFFPDQNEPQWAACQSADGLYQSLLIQFTGSQEILRISGIKDSLRNGKEIRFGKSGTLEERNYENGHLQGPSWIFKSDAVLSRIAPKPIPATIWGEFITGSEKSLLSTWLKQEPDSTVTYQKGRLARIQFEKKDYQFKVADDGRIFAVNHPEMKKLFFTDPEGFWSLSGKDLNKAITPGFGSCKKYAGPIGRFARHYEKLLYKRETQERTHFSKLKTIQDRFIQFCVPKDLNDHLGQIECPPQLPGKSPVHHCALAISDQIKIPYRPQYFKFEASYGRPPLQFVHELKEKGLLKFLSDPQSEGTVISLSNEEPVLLRKTARGIQFKTLEKGEKPPPVNGFQQDKHWWEWRSLPAH